MHIPWMENERLQTEPTTVRRGGVSKILVSNAPRIFPLSQLELGGLLSVIHEHELDEGRSDSDRRERRQSVGGEVSSEALAVEVFSRLRTVEGVTINRLFLVLSQPRFLQIGRRVREHRYGGSAPETWAEDAVGLNLK